MKSEKSSSEEIKERFPDKRLVKGFMGGAVFADEKDGKFYVIEDEGTLASFLSPEDADLLEMLVRVNEFDTLQEREQYLKMKGWL
jgi:hypothetical protein